MNQTLQPKSPDRSDSEVFVVLCTVPSPEVGRGLAHRLVGSGAAACVNLIPGLASIYRWEGEVHEDAELLLLVKTDARRLDTVIATIESEHPYACPEAIALPVSSGSRPYLTWLRSMLD